MYLKIFCVNLWQSITVNLDIYTFAAILLYSGFKLYKNLIVFQI